MKRPFFISLLMSFVAFLMSASSINNGLIDSSMSPGPGLTLDESFNIEQGVYVFDAFCHHGPMLFTPSKAQEVFGSKRYFPDHPPLARAVLGAFHQTFGWLIPGSSGSAYNVPAARLGSCFLFAMTVLLLSEFARRRYGLLTAIIAAVFLMLMPRVLGHSRIAAQETGTTLAWLAATLALASWWTNPEPPTVRQSLLSGLLFGVLLATKVQGILLPPLVVVWAFWNFRERAVAPLAIWGFTGAIVFFLGWPWLWLDPVNNIRMYFIKTADRPELYVWYLGERYVDKLVPWHYPLVLTVVTVPLYALAGLGMRAFCRRFDRCELFLAATAAWPLFVFAMPGTPVYDGTRLFLVIMPAVALLAARGAVLFLHSEETRVARKPVRLSAALLTFVAVLLVLPRTIGSSGLCDYNLLTGGPRGAFAIGLDSDYWASGLNGEFWERVPEGSTIFVAPVCHQFQLGDIQQLVPTVRQRNIKLTLYEYNPEKQRGLILLIHRLADLPPHLREVPNGANVIAEAKFAGVTLARLIDTTSGTWKRQPNWPGDELPPDNL